MRYSRISLLVVPIFFAALGCDDDPVRSAVVGPPSVDLTIAPVSGDAQTGRAGERLAQPMVVRVTDASGRPARANVTWSVSGGPAVGLVCYTNPRGKCSSGWEETLLTTTNTAGEAYAVFYPLSLGPLEVRASVATGRQTRFSATADGVVIRLAPLFDCTPNDRPSFIGPSLTEHVTVPLGTSVEWHNAAWNCGAARIVSTTAPSTGLDFDSGDLALNDRYQYTPLMAGTWTFVDQVSGAEGTLTAR